MNAGKTKHPVGTKIKLKNQPKDFKGLNGATGELTHTFGNLGGTDYGAIAGVYLDKEYEHLCHDGRLHVFSEKEFDLID